MKIAFVIYDGMTTLDFAGAFDPITRLKTMGFVPDLEWDVCAFSEKVKSWEGLEILPSRVKNNLSGYDYVIVPGGNSIGTLVKDAKFILWLKNTDKDAKIAAVCGGSILLGVAGGLDGKKATTHPALIDYLRKFAKEVSNERIVDDGNVITARGVTSSIDLGLYICEKIAGEDIRKTIQKQMDYLNYSMDPERQRGDLKERTAMARKQKTTIQAGGASAPQQTKKPL
ncbi:MAG: DJ-1/PfpI family protein [Candidatus Micrarchaeia archaeon]